jgi:S1-C subfamily serine protease
VLRTFTHPAIAVLALVLMASGPAQNDNEAPSVVYIGGWEGTRAVVGAGVVVERDGDHAIVATAGHVASFERAFVTTRTSRVHRPMTVLARAQDADLALIETDVVDVTVATLAEPVEGQRGSIIGHPFDRAWTRAEARVLGPRVVEDYEARPTQVVVSCSRCGPGDSGGSILDARSRLIGIATAAFGQTMYGVDSCGVRALLQGYGRKRAIDVGHACNAALALR